MEDLLEASPPQKAQEQEAFHPPTPPKVDGGSDVSPTNQLRRHFSHKGEKVCSYTVAFKLEVIHYAEQSSNHTAGRRYNVSRSSVRDWRKKKQKLEEMMMLKNSGAHRRRLNGGGRKIVDSSTEKLLVEWIMERKRQCLNTSGALIIKKAQSLQQEKVEKTHTLKYSRGWLEKFMKRNGLSLKSRNDHIAGAAYRTNEHSAAYRADVAGYRLDAGSMYRGDVSAAYRADIAGYRVDGGGVGYRAEPLGYRGDQTGYRNEHAHPQYCYDQTRGNNLQSLLTIADPHAHAWAKCHNYVSAGAH